LSILKPFAFISYILFANERVVNPSTPQHKSWDLPFDKLKALSSIEGLRVDPERRFFTPHSRAYLGAAEWVNFFQLANGPRFMSFGQDVMYVQAVKLRPNGRGRSTELSALSMSKGFPVRQFPLILCPLAPS
jgi:hypothetical protein